MNDWPHTGMRRLRVLLFLSCLGSVVVMSWVGWQAATRSYFDQGFAPPDSLADSPWTEPLRIRVIGEQFRWRFIYSGADGQFGTADDIDAAHELRLPVSIPCELDVTSRDYIYALSLAPFDAREIAIPDLTFPVSFQPNRIGKFEIRVEPLCGYIRQHDEVMAMLFVMKRQDFSGWYRSQL